MRFNDKEMALLSKRPSKFEGRLQYRAPPGSFRDTGFRERFFKLIGNLLFYFRITEMGTIDYKEPVGVIVLENFAVAPEMDSDLSFAFGILFLDEQDKRHIFTARTDSDVHLWVNELRQASYQHWKEQLHSMQLRLSTLRDTKISAQSAASLQQPRFAGGLNMIDNSVRPRVNPFLQTTPKSQKKSNSKEKDLIQF